ncbi:efflux RND transporter permease subunit [Amylibacter sp. IMCC11727]|uniref:efflux RND transporter permease subunit n=1 Tax=Amylibacter sp. IMCC11727 TaxID=3039851 RepID=UPI00244E0384|nr:efflux RND transporter permease subunit [Amylibacter sp. IMCC11727]WGI22733.1 efflux RND transporter permease subunit [Amylibacter sp. IMCC11727]
MSRQLSRSAGGLLSYFTRHRTAANLLLVMMLVIGLGSMTQIRSQFFPDVIIDSVTVTVGWEGAGPEDVDNGIVAVLEPALLAVEGIESSQSTATQGRARIYLEFEPDWDMARAADDVKVAVDAVTGLPDGADDPNIRRGAWRDRVTDVVISGPVSPEQLGRFADEFSARLFRAGVTRTTIRGVSAPEIVVNAPEISLIRNDVSLREIADAIAEEAETDPAGDVAGGSARVRTGIEKRSADQVQQIVVRSNPDGSKLRVGDVADVTVEGVDRERSYYVGNNPAVSIRVDRADQGDAIRMQNSVQAVADEMQLTLPEGVTIELIRTRAQSITDRLNILVDNGLVGLGLVVLLLFIFLNARTAFWVAAGIPAAMFAAVAIMYAAGLTINMVSLFGLIITLGIVVDDAIVVGEHADFRARQMGEDPIQAAENAAIRMAPPVFSATVTTVIAFFGLVTIGGRFGSLIIDIPFTVIAVLIASLVECFIILPNHMSHALHAFKNKRWYDWPSETFNKGFNWFKRVVFRRFINGVLVLRYPVLAGVTVLLASQAALFISGDVRWRFFNAPERASISGNIAMLSGATRDDTLEMVRELQRAVRDTAAEYEKEHGINPVTYVLAEVGGNTDRSLSGSDTKDVDQLGSIAVELIDADSRPYTSFELVAAIQDNVRKHPLLETVSFRGWRSGPGGDSMDIQIYGATASVLKSSAEALKAAVAQFPEVSAVEDNLAYDKEELVLELTPQGQSLGFTIDAIGRELRSRLNGIEAASFPVGVRTAEITVRLPESELTADFLNKTRLRTPMGTYVPLSDVVTVETELGFSTVRRENGIGLISVTGDISEDNADRAAFINDQLRTVIMPQIASDFGVEWRMSGLAEQEQEFLSDAFLGFSLCMLGIYLTLTWIFASWTRPLVVMAVIPFGLIGTIYGHHAWGVPLSMFSVVGLIGMSGIIINDSIVLVTTVDEYSKSRGLFPAIVDAATDRFRPVLLTTLTTVLGLTPLLYEGSRQAEFLKPTVITLCYGLGVGLFLVLLVVPSLLVIQKDIGNLFTSYRRAATGRHTALSHRVVVWGASTASLALLIATIGLYVATQDTPAWITALGISAFDNMNGAMPALIVLLLGLICTALLAVFIAAVWQTAVKRRTA